MKDQVRILVADDHGVVRRGVKALLETESKWRVCAEAATGHEAIRRAKTDRPDVVVLDISMPDLNGFAVARQIRKVSPETKVLIFSVHDSEPIIREALDAGADAYICKSDLDRDLLEAVGAVLANKKFFGAKLTEFAVERYFKTSGTTASTTRSRSEITPRQRDVLRLLAEGKANKEVAALLGISVKTVETHRNAIMRRLELHSFSDLVRYAVRNRLVEA
jgi:DNA-binding NarL/FixJ family response regulator